MLREEDLVTMAQIAERFGVTVQAVKQWRYRKYLDFPEPDLQGPERGATPYWRWARVKVWALAHRPNLL